MKKITLSGKPLSTNHIYKSMCLGGCPKVYMSKTGKDRKEQYQWEAKSQWKAEPTDGEVSLDIILFFDDQRRHDIDNYNKIVLDSLSGIVFEDDNQITDIFIQKDFDKENPRIEVIVN